MFLKESFTHLTKDEWRDWTGGLIELSNFLWKNRDKDKIEPNLWLEVSRKIYDVSFKNFQQFDAFKRVSRECKYCSRLLSVILYNFAVNAKEDESPEHFCIPLIDKIRETAMKNIGVPWYYVTYNALIEERVK